MALRSLAFALSSLALAGACFLEEPDVEQPIPFNHRLHVVKNKIPCTDCHVGAVRGVRATLPPLTRCLLCHMKPQGKAPNPREQVVRKLAASGTPVVWRQVTKNPRHVYFLASGSHHLREAHLRQVPRRRGSLDGATGGAQREVAADEHMPELPPQARCHAGLRFLPPLLKDRHQMSQQKSFGRRELLRAVGVGAAGALLGACEHEEDPFEDRPPVPGEPAWPSGLPSWITTTCGQCFAGCGIRVRVLAGRANHVAGNLESPVNGAGVGPKGHSGLQVL
jgi:hypothetical protein